MKDNFNNRGLADIIKLTVAAQGILKQVSPVLLPETCGSRVPLWQTNCKIHASHQLGPQVHNVGGLGKEDWQVATHLVGYTCIIVVDQLKLPK